MHGSDKSLRFFLLQVATWLADLFFDTRRYFVGDRVVFEPQQFSFAGQHNSFVLCQRYFGADDQNR